MWTRTLATCFFALSLSLAEDLNVCSCNGLIDSDDQGECRTTRWNRPWCYVDRAECPNARKDHDRGPGDWYWDYEPCERDFDSGNSSPAGQSTIKYFYQSCLPVVVPIEMFEWRNP